MCLRLYRIDRDLHAFDRPKHAVLRTEEPRHTDTEPLAHDINRVRRDVSSTASILREHADWFVAHSDATLKVLSCCRLNRFKREMMQSVPAAPPPRHVAAPAYSYAEPAYVFVRHLCSVVAHQEHRPPGPQRYPSSTSHAPHAAPSLRFGLDEHDGIQVYKP